MASRRLRADEMEFPILWNFMAVLATLVFIGVVGFGWRRLLANYALTPTLAFATAGILAVFAAALAFVMGAKRAAAKRAREQGREAGSRSWLFLYPFLFALSALGLVTTFFYVLEGSVVLQEEIDKAQVQLAVLDSAAVEGLRDPAHEAKAARVAQLLSSLRREIDSPNLLCGVGPAARDIIRRIQRELPDYHEYAGSTAHGCNSEQVERVARSYELQAQEMLLEDREYVASGGRDRQTFLASLRNAVAEAQAQLVAAEERLGSSGGGGSSYAEAQHALQNASTVYSRFRDSLVRRAARPVPDLPPRLDVALVDHMDSVGAIIPTLIQRLSHLSTWGYLLFALIIDIGLVLLLSVVVANLRRRPGEDGAEPAGHQPPGAGPRRAVDPAFLWVN